MALAKDAERGAVNPHHLAKAVAARVNYINAARASHAVRGLVARKSG